MASAEDAYAEYLKNIPLFRDLAHDEIMDVIRACAIKPVASGTVLCTEGDPGDAMFVVESGEVRVEKKTVQGIPEELARLGPGSVVGEMALLDGRPRSATVVMTKPGTIYRIDQGAFGLLRANLRPSAFKVIRFLARSLCGHLRDLNQRMEEFYAKPEESIRVIRQRQQAIQQGLRQRMATRPAFPAAPPPRPGTAAPAPDKDTVAQTFVRPYLAGGEAERLAFLAQVPMFKGLQPNELKVLNAVLHEQSYGDGEVVCREGDTGNGFYVVAFGRVSVEKAIPGGPPQTLVTLAPGALIGEVSLIDGGKRSATCVARGPSMVFRCSQDDFDALFRAKSPFAFKFVDRLAMDVSKRVREANARFTDIFSRPGETLEHLVARVREIHASLEAQDETSDLLKMMGFRSVPSGG